MESPNFEIIVLTELDGSRSSHLTHPPDHQFEHANSVIYKDSGDRDKAGRRIFRAMSTSLTEIPPSFR